MPSSSSAVQMKENQGAGAGGGVGWGHVAGGREVNTLGKDGDGMGRNYSLENSNYKLS